MREHRTKDDAPTTTWNGDSHRSELLRALQAFAVLLRRPVLHPGDGEALNMTYHTGAPERAPAQRPRVESSTGGGGTAFLEETISTEILLLGCFPGGGPSAIAGASVTFSSRTIEREKVRKRYEIEFRIISKKLLFTTDLWLVSWATERLFHLGTLLMYTIFGPR